MIPPSANLYKNADESNGEYDSFKKILNLSATTPIKYSQGRLLQNDVKQKPTQDAATDDGCCTLHFCFRYCQYPRL